MLRGRLENDQVAVTPLRFALAITMAPRAKRGACAILATVCSSWVYLSRSQLLGTLSFLEGTLKLQLSAKRTFWNPLGDRTVKWVEDANVARQPTRTHSFLT